MTPVPASRDSAWVRASRALANAVVREKERQETVDRNLLVVAPAPQ